MDYREDDISLGLQSHMVDNTPAYQHLRAETIRMISEIQSELPSRCNGNSSTQSHAEANLIRLWRRSFLEDNRFAESDIQVGNQMYPGSNHTVTYLIIYYLLENGCADVVDRLTSESGEDEELIRIRDNYIKLRKITGEIGRDAMGLLEEFVADGGSKNLELCMISHEFLLLIYSGRYDEALRMCFKRLRSFVPKYIQDVKPILRFLVNPADIQEALEKSRERLIDEFESSYLEINGMPNRCYLKELFETGTSAFLQLAESGSLFFDKDDHTLPVEIKIRKGFNYHSLFVCPVLKTLCIDGNVPVMLECGHVISSDAAGVLSQEGVLSSFKCPYCPEMSRYENIMKLKF